MNAGDLVVIAIILLSGLIALWRGLIREVLSLAGWIGAGLVTLWGFALIRPYARSLIENALLADLAAGVLLFIVSLVVFSVISAAISNLVRNSSLNAVDRTLGFVFGLARGLVAVALAYIALALWVWAKPADRPEWVTKARTLPLIETTADILRSFAPPEFRGKAQAVEDEATRRARQAQEAQRALRALGTPLPTGITPAPDSETGYKTDVRRDLERLIQNTAPPEGQANR
jgi:membrane protein required for colicin V production